MSEIRQIERGDLKELKEVLDSIELFPSEILDGLIADYFDNPETQDFWFTAIEKGKPVSIAYCVPEKLTRGTFNLYSIGVRDDMQGKGIGRKMMAYIEERLKQSGARVLIVETSGDDSFRLARKFYENLNYTKEAVIRDFWNEGDDKVVYWKKLN